MPSSFTRLLRRFSVASAAILTSQLLPAGELPEYHPHDQVSGLIRNWGCDEMTGVVSKWEAGFSQIHKDIRFSDTLRGSDSAQAGLYCGVADLALMDREIPPLEVYPLFRRKHYFPTEIQIGTGTADGKSHAFALGIFVNRNNPVSHLSFSQLDGIFGAQRNGYLDMSLIWHDVTDRDASRNIRTWGQLGVTGEMADQPIHVYGYPTTVWAIDPKAPGASNFFRERVLKGGDKWNPSLVECESSEEIAAAVARDPDAIAYTGAGYVGTDVKSVAISAADANAPIPLSRETVASREYPLARALYVYIDKDPAKPLDPKIKEFLTYILSKDGQADLASGGEYSALPPELLQEQLKKLD